MSYKKPLRNEQFQTHMVGDMGRAGRGGCPFAVRQRGLAWSARSAWWWCVPYCGDNKQYGHGLHVYVPLSLE